MMDCERVLLASSRLGVMNSTNITSTLIETPRLFVRDHIHNQELDNKFNNLQNEVNSKANTNHTHTIANVTNLQTELNNKANTNHTHATVDSLGASFRTSLINLIYPVGSIYTSFNSTSPNTLFGGTWTQIVNRFLYCASTSNTTVGSNKIDIAHLPAHHHAVNLNTNNVGAHTHVTSIMSANSGTGTDVNFDQLNTVGNSRGWRNFTSTSAGAHTHNITGNTANTGSGSDFMPPFITVFAWRRTA
jgi:hypothetical protein